MSTENSVIVNPLLTREVRPIHSWNEFLEHWQEATTYEEMLGLLHVGFALPFDSVNDYIDKLVFYFGVADGWIDRDLLQTPADKEKFYRVGSSRGFNFRDEIKRPREFRQMLAFKAFDMISQNFFKEESKNSSDRLTTNQGKWVASERLLPVIQSFFRTEDRSFEKKYKNRNLHYWPEHRTHSEEHAIVFLLKLAEYIWDWKEKEFTELSPCESEKKMATERRSFLDSAEPWMIDVLACLKRLDVLRKWLLELNEPCLAKLKGIALHNELKWHYHPVLHDRPVTTIDEACCAGSTAAWLLKEREIKKAEHERLSAVLVAELAREEAEKQLRRLTAN